MTAASGERRVLVTQIRREADGVVSLRLADPDGAVLPAWEPGAHLDLRLPSGAVRQYSLCGDPADAAAYTVAVLREEAGRGGSAEIHDTALVGREVTIRGPRNRFPLVAAPAYCFVAGGIGITPILAMIRELAAGYVPWTLHYGGRSLRSMAFRDELAEWGRSGAGRVVFRPEAETGRLPLDEILAATTAGTAVYTCGPPGLIRAMEERVDVAIPAGALHFERFTGEVRPELENPCDTKTFEVELAQSGDVLEVPPGESILDVVRAVRPEVMSSCEEGFCGTCETKVLSGVPEHRDSILSDTDREKNCTMMICVGRSKTRRLVLDL
jgi:ferredoxin-NADP reductase